MSAPILDPSKHEPELPTNLGLPRTMESGAKLYDDFRFAVAADTDGIDVDKYASTAGDVDLLAEGERMLKEKKSKSKKKKGGTRRRHTKRRNTKHRRSKRRHNKKTRRKRRRSKRGKK